MQGQKLGDAEEPWEEFNLAPALTEHPDDGGHRQGQRKQALETGKLSARQILVRAASQKWWELESGCGKQEVSEDRKYRQLL